MYIKYVSVLLPGEHKMSEIQLFAYYSLTEKLCMFIVEIDPQLVLGWDGVEVLLMTLGWRQCWQGGALRDLRGSAQTGANKSSVSRPVSVCFGRAAYFTDKLFQKETLINDLYHFS